LNCAEVTFRLRTIILHLHVFLSSAFLDSTSSSRFKDRNFNTKMYESFSSRAIAWWLLVNAASSLGPEHNASLVIHRTSDLPSLALLQYGRTLPRCSNHSLIESLNQDNGTSGYSAFNITIDLAPAETKPGHRLVGSHLGDKYSCYPLSDEDFWRSREAVCAQQAFWLTETL